MEQQEQEHYIATLKRAYAAIRGANTSLKKKNEHLKQLCKEGDELYEAQIKENEDLKKQLLLQKAQYQQKIEDIEKDCFYMKTNINWYNELPWYKKIFVRKIS